MKKTIALIFQVVLFNYACSQKDIRKSVELNYELTHAFHMQVEDHPLRTWSLQTKVIADDEFLFFGDVKTKDNIKVYNMNTRSWEESIRFEKEGPNGIGRMNGFYVHSLDSIFLVQSFAWQVYLMDRDKKVKTYYTKGGIAPFEQITPFTTNNALKGIIDGKLIFYGFPEIPYEGSDYHNKVNVAQSIDLKTGKNSMGIGYPEQYHNHLWPGIIVISNEQEICGELIYMNFPFSDSVFVYNSSFNPIKVLNVPSTEKKKTSNFDGKAFEHINGEPAYLEYLEKGTYSDILIDCKRNLLYRTIAYSKSEHSSFNNISDYRSTIEVNLLVYNMETDQLIGELDFSKSELDRVPMMFVGEKGLYLSKMSDEEEVVDFYLLTLK